MAKPFHECTGCMFPVGELFCNSPVPKGNIYCAQHEAASRLGPGKHFNQLGVDGVAAKRDDDQVVAVDDFMRGRR